MKPGFVSLAVGLLLLTGCGGQDGADPAYRASLDEWHAGRLERLQAEDGWLTLVGLHPLVPGTHTVGAAADRDLVLDAAVPDRVGTLAVTADALSFTPEPGVAVMADGVAVTGTVALASDADGAPTVLQLGSVRGHVIARGDRMFLRVKDSASPVRRDFAGIDRFPVDEAWRVTARLETAGMPPTVPISNVLGQVEQQPSPGVLVFELDGRPYRLIPTGQPGERMFIVFGDRSNGHDTYGGGRYLSADPPDAEGRVVLDFNRATNPPCAFTPYATCPLPPRENLLPVAVTAGEKAWGGHH
jgi:uncharacterized protein (DUF1684 family)